ncbi:MAG: iron ABC transporter substrate-binding protein [Anaerolineae bacterium]|nr:iron ABC transporter substrate-binding protein [Anaerolineae bacterium]
MIRKFFIILILITTSACQQSAPAPQEASEPVEDQAPSQSDSLTIYSGRSESLVGPLLEQFKEETGLDVEVRYGDTAEMASTILEEGDNSPADVYYGQDAGALGALEKEGRFASLPEAILNQVEPGFRSPEGGWIGTSGRARTVVYNTNLLTEADLPDDIFGFCDSQWLGRIGWAPTNGSFQAFVTALRVVEGEERAREWLYCIQSNDPLVYANNSSIVESVGSGEIEVGFVNHYYLFRYLAEDPDFPAANYFPRSGDVGAMINVAGVGIINTTNTMDAAETFVQFLLQESAQEYFNTETHEYPLSADIPLDPQLPPLNSLNTPDIELNNLDDLEGTLQLLQEAGIL